MRILCATLLSAMLAPAAFSQSLGQVPFERIVNADQTPGDWLTYSRDFSGQRFSPLAEINADNVANLKVKWAFQFTADRNEVSPLVFGGVMYVTAGNWAAALDVHTGRPFWTWQRAIPEDYHNIGFGRVNRGPAVLDDKLFVTTLDCRLVALDLKSGAERWNAKVCDYKLGYSMTVAPLAIDGKIVVGVSGGEAGIRGFLDAYDAKSGKRVWRFWTIPGPGEPGHETWSGDSWRTGGGPTWVTGAYDPDLKLVYWGVGNPSPDWNGDARRGDNLYACSLLAIDAVTGKLRWHFQFTPHDTHDWDAAHTPVLFEAQIAGRDRKLIAEANRNAFYYVLDRVTGEFVAGQPFAKETWASGLGSKGRPLPTPDSVPSEKGALIWPNLNGATVWFSPSYSPQTGLFYVAARNVGSVYFKREAAYKPDTFFAGGGEDELPPDESWGEIRALQAATGETKWIFRLHTPPWAGVLSTAGGLVFSGTNEGNFFALDARTGKSLWEFQTGGPISANPVSYNEDGKQRIAICAERVLYVFGL